MLLDMHYENFEHFAEQINGWSVDFYQLDKGPFAATLKQVVHRNLLVSHGVFSRKLEQHGTAPEDMWTFALLNTQSPEIIWRGTPIYDHLVIYRPGSEIDALSPPGFDVLTFSIPNQEVERLTSFYHTEGYPSFDNCNDIIRVNRHTLDTIRTLARPLLTSSVLSLVAHEVEIVINHLLIDAAMNGKTIRTRPKKTKDYKEFKNLTNYINDNLTDKIYIDDLCHLSQMSPRTILRLFKSYLDITPSGYIKSMRLNRVRRDLLQSSGDNGYIADAANEWGFWHMGQFARDYCQLFGELPSQTRRGANGSG